MANKMSPPIKLRDLINMTNGVLGLVVLAMPFCFAQAGIILATITLATCACLTSFSCKLLMKTVEIKKIRSLEYLALRLFGHKAKLCLEITIILLLFGTLVTYQQILSDSGPVFISKLLGYDNIVISREMFMFFFTILITVPMSLLKKIDKINKISTLSMSFYFVFCLYLMVKASEKMTDLKFPEKIVFWNFTGLIKVLPILSLSFSCQTGLFVVFNELPENSKDIITKLVDYAISVAFAAYFLAGFFGYLAFYDVEIHGNVLTNISGSTARQFLILGFTVCVLSGSAICIFPCRTCLNTFLFSTEKSDILENDVPMSETRFRNFTFLIVACIVLTAILIPNLEFVLSLVGATAGSLLSYVWPSLMYIFARQKTNNYKEVLVNIFFCLGIAMFFICTLTSLIEYQPTKENDIITILDSSTNDIKAKILEEVAVNEFRNNDLVRHEPANPMEDVENLNYNNVPQNQENKKNQILQNIVAKKQIPDFDEPKPNEIFNKRKLESLHRINREIINGTWATILKEIFKNNTS